ncbi:hypothetical protein [Bartonella sp. DGB2]|uniref:hypothetical protein n=1 Tax=Bartonella sp. DGB2 TaxID=3388426 RepID=UPI00398FF884
MADKSILFLRFVDRRGVKIIYKKLKEPLLIGMLIGSVSGSISASLCAYGYLAIPGVGPLILKGRALVIMLGSSTGAFSGIFLAGTLGLLTQAFVEKFRL